MVVLVLLLLQNQPAGSVRQPDLGTLTRPNGPSFRVPPKAPDQVQLRNAVPGDTVTPEIPTYEYQAHMSFQQSIDTVDSKVERLSDRVGNVEKTQTGDDTKLGSLSDDRIEIKVWLKVLLGMWGLISGLVSRDIWLPWVKKKLGIPASQQSPAGP